MPYVSATLIVNTSSSSKRLRLNEKSYTLWYKRFGHISKQIMKRLIKDGILSDLNFSNFNTCVDCINGKLTTKVDRSTELLRVIHTYIYGSFTHPVMGGHKYFYDALKSGGPLITQPAECLWISYNSIQYRCVPFTGIHNLTKIR